MTYTPDYAEEFHKRVEEAREIANKAKEKGEDPQPFVEIPMAEDMAERCEKLLEREYGDKIHGLAQLIRELEESDEVDGREEMSLYLAEEFATGELSEDFDNDAERVEAAIRTSIAILTEGVVAAPIEGLGKVSIDDNDDGTKFLRIPYFGPIRSAGGTAQAVSVLVADYVRDLLDIAVFKPREEEVERYVEEIELYDSAVGMQYCPPKEKSRYIIKHTPIMVDGQPNLNAVGREVDGYRDLERIEGNAPRDGMCLVMAEGIGLKAPKLQRYAEAFDLESWHWLDKLIQGSGDDEGEDEEEQDENDDEVSYTVPNRSDEANVLDPSEKFMGDALAGRPIFAGPSQVGGFRLRYGRSRNAGHAAVGFSPATMVLTDEFIAPSTQIKTERPGKAAGAVPVDSIEGPTVRLNNGVVKRVDTYEGAKKVQNNVEKILDLGEIAVPYGEFVENNHPLAPATYSPDWWSLELEDAGGNPDEIQHDQISAQEAIEISEQYDVPLHPEYTYLWHDIEPDEYAALNYVLQNAENQNDEYHLPAEIHTVLEKLLVPHTQKPETTIINSGVYEVLQHCTTDEPVDDDVLGQINDTAPFTVRPRSLTRIGGRMGRPEKAEKREMKPMVNSLFPIRDAGSDERLINKAANHTENADHKLSGMSNPDEFSGKGVVDVELNYRVCTDCDEVTFKSKCPECSSKTEEKMVCGGCKNVDDSKEIGDQCRRCGSSYGLTTERQLNVNEEYQNALENINERPSSIGKVKAVKRLTSDSKIPEPLEKGLLRAKYDVSTFRDGTARYDMCDLPLTSFKPSEIGVSVDKIKELGYEETVDGEPIESEDDLIEIYMQDVIVAEEAGEYLLDVANYIDDLLVKYYDMEPYYEADEPEDLVGSLLIGMAPHTSAGVVGRLLGFTTASANYAHPFFHAAKRRNCFHPDTELDVKINGEWKETTIGNLVETHLEPDSNGYDDSYDDGTIVQNTSEHPEIDEIKVPSMTDEGHQTIEDVTHLSRHKSPKHMISIKTEDGCELKVTPEHKIPVRSSKDDTLMDEKKAHQVENGDLLFNYGREKVEDVKDYEDIDLLKHLLQERDQHEFDIDNVMVRGLEKEELYNIFEENIKPEWDDGQFYVLSSTCDYLGVTKTTLENYIRRESIPAALLLNIYDDVNDMIDSIPSYVELGMNSDSVSVPRIQSLDEELSCLIGYYTAEGYCRTTKDTRMEHDMDACNQVDFAATESQPREFIEEVLEHKFNVHNPYKTDTRITASGKMIKFFFSNILDSGDGCYTKKVPEYIQNSSDKIKGHYLSGYLSGDGGEFGGKMQAFTGSEELKDTLVNLCNCLGISVNIEECEPVLLRERFPDFYDDDDDSMSAGGYKMEISKEIGMQLKRKNIVSREYDVKKVIEVSHNKCKDNYTYNLTVNRTHRLSASETLSRQCDGDEDSVMLLMDGLINFSRKYLPSQRGKNMMDAPIVMSTVINPEEIDDEAHNVDVVDRYPLEFYEATMEAEDPDNIDIEIAEDRLESPVNVKHSLATSDINAGPRNTAYKSVDGMDDATKKQLDLAEATRGVDEEQVASLIIEKHFFPDIIGNLTAFSRQEFQCSNNHMHRRAPASGRCQQRDWCDAPVRLTVYEGMVDKYMETATELADEYDLDLYTRQRLEFMSERIEQLFKDDKEEQTGLDDFM